MFGALMAMAIALHGDLAVETGAHSGRVAVEAIEWRSIWVVKRTIEIGTEAVALALPLHPETRLESPEDAEPIRDAAGRIVAIALPEHLWRIGRVELVTRQPRGGAPERLAPPIARGSEIDRVVIEEGTHFSPSGEAGLEPHVGYWTAPGLSDALKERADHLAVAASHEGQKPIYLRAETMNRGLSGELAPTAVSARAPIVAGAAFISLVLVLAGLHRILARRAEVERAEAALREELRNLET